MLDGATENLLKCFRNLFARLYVCSEIEVKLSSVFLGFSVKNQESSHVIHLTFTFVTNLKLRPDLVLDRDRLVGFVDCTRSLSGAPNTGRTGRTGACVPMSLGSLQL